MLKLKDLNAENVSAARARFAQRAAAISVFHPILFSLIILLDFNGQRFPELLPGLYSMVLWMLVRGFLWNRGRKNKLVWSKSVFWLAFVASTIGVAATWGISLLVVYLHAGLTPPMVMMMILCVGIVAIGAPSASLDLWNGFSFVFLIIAPAMVALLLNHKSSADLVVGIGLVMYILSVWILVLNLHRFQVEFMHKIEIIDGQRKDLLRSHSTITAMLESTGEGFLIFDRQGLCISQPSSVSRTLLGLDAFQNNIWDVLQVSSEQRAEFEPWYGLLFLDRMEFSEVADLGPKQIYLKSSGKKLKIKFYPIRDSSSVVEAITMTVDDITAELKAKADVEDLQVRAEMILRIQKNRIGFRDWLNALDEVCAKMKSGKTLNMEDLRRELHTLKGTAMIYSVNVAAGILYDTELRLRDAVAANPDASTLQKLLAECAVDLKQHLDNWRLRDGELLNQLGVTADVALEVGPAKLQAVEKAVSSDPSDLRSWQKVKRLLQSDDVADLLKQFEPHILKVARDLERKVEYRVHSPADATLIAQGTLQKTISTFVHLFNNAVDHAIENPAEREAAGKPPQGLLDVIVARENGRVKLTFRDDGRGIDTEAIQKKTGTKENKIDLAMHIFDDGFSTRSSVTRLSGQGVGLSAVRDAIRESGGDIQIVKTDHSGTTFEIHLPLPV